MSLGPSSTSDSSRPKERWIFPLEPFGIGEWQAEPELLRLRKGEEVRKLEPMAMRLLVFLVQRPGEVVSRAEILEEVWEGRAVVDETLSRGISLVRQALGDNAQEPAYIETIPRRGYRVIAPVGSPFGPTSGTFREDGKTHPALEDEPKPRWIWPGLGLLLMLLAVWWWQDFSSFQRGTPAAKAEQPENPQRPGIAVLPFKNLSPDPANVYLADGLTEELIHQLAGVSGLRVVSRTSSMRFRDSGALAPEIAEALRVDYLLEGTVLVADGRLRITAQLIRPDQDDHLLSRSYDRDLTEVLDLQREVAQDVVQHTQTELSTQETRRLSRHRPVSSDSYRAYLQGHQFVQRRYDLARGLDLLKRSVELDPEFAPAWAALADAHLLSNSYTVQSEEAAYAGAQAAIEKALDLDPELAAAHASLGLLRLQRDHDEASSEASYRRAIALEPSYVTARQWYSELLSLFGRHEEALEQVRVALDLDPLSSLVHAAAGQRLHAAGRYEEALDRFEDVEALGADFTWHLREKSWVLHRLGRHEESLRIQLFLARRRDISPERLEALESSVSEAGLTGYYRWEVQRLLALERRRPGFPTWLAKAFAGAGETEKALEQIRKAAREQNLWLLHTQKSPAFDALREDPRFEEALGDLPAWRSAEEATGRGKGQPIRG